ncbi:MAG: dihydroorotase, partial [Candidatus Kariarchaeaceae archaeon]
MKTKSSSSGTSIHFSNGQIVTPTSVFIGSVVTYGKTIIAVYKGKPIDEITADKEIDCTGMIILPGVIDPHVHFGIPMPTATAVDNLHTGSIAAAYGGVTTFIDYINPSRKESPREVVQSTINNAPKTYVDYSFHCSLVSDREEVLKEIPEIIELGVSSFKLFFTYKNLKLSYEQLDRVISELTKYNTLAQFHCELDHLLAPEIEKYVSQEMGEAINHSHSRPAIAEVEAINQALELTTKYKLPMYVVHLSSGAGLERLRQAKKERKDLYVETCPHYLLLNTSSLEDPETGPLFIMSPPIRSEEDNRILWEGVLDGTIDVIATDHVSFTKEQKGMGSKPFWKVPNGVMGVETTLSLIYHEGVVKRGLSLQRMVELISSNPAKILGLTAKGHIAPGMNADIVVFDPYVEWTLSPENLHM